MVCWVNETMVNKVDEKEVNNHPNEKETNEMIDLSRDHDLKLKRLAGGSIVDYPPLFSPDGESLFIISGKSIQIYSAITGELVRLLEGFKDDIIGLQYDLTNKKYLLACTKTGQIARWKWKSGALESQVQVELPQRTECNICTFNVLEISSDTNYALIIYSSNIFTKWAVIDTVTGRSVNCPITLELENDEPVFVTTETKYFHYFAIAQGPFLYVVNYKSWSFNRCRNARWTNAHKSEEMHARNVPFTCIQAHPSENMLATGDEMGRIFLWRQMWKRNKLPSTSLYHWHHTPVTNVTFTTVGSSFYSAGHEAVLVKWNMDRPDLKDFLPRMSAMILHISVSGQNRRIAVSTADNGVHILGAQNKQLCVLQNFTCVYDSRTGLDKFPVGLQLNPRSNSLVLNGRIGYLQFFSTYTKSLLYNMDIVIQNRLSPEAQKILYDIRVTRAAFNIDWMATGEVWDDQNHAPELRLKFWQYQKENQNYTLNTNVELPHEGGFNAIEFSNQHETENLLCATVGKDDVIKIWSLEDSNNIYKKGKIWFCIGQTNYKNMHIESIHFSRDGSLLAAGFGNNLCIYTPENLKLKSVLTAPPALDGSLQKVQICMPKESSNDCKSPQVKNNTKVKRQQVLQLFKELLEKGDLVQQINRYKINGSKPNSKESTSLKLTPKQEEVLFRKIQSTSELNLFQKLNLYQKLEIFCSVPKESQGKLLQYINSTIFEDAKAECNLFKSVRDVCKRHRFKAKYKLQKYISRKRHYSSQINDKLISLMDLLNINDSSSENEQNNGAYNKCNGFAGLNSNHSYEIFKKNKSDIFPLQNVSSIRSIHFATGEFAHLVVVCTEHRVLVWNLFTLRLQCVLKLSVHKIVVDPVTSLFAAFTRNSELYVFLPNAPMVIYRRTNLPLIHGACWVPKRYPKSQSINIDWQSMSTLYFLTDKQELMFLASESDVEPAISAPNFSSEPDEAFKYSTFGAFAIKQVNAKSKAVNNSSMSIGVPGKAATKRLVDMSTHAMAPVNFLCNDYIKSLLSIVKDENPPNKDEEQVMITEENDSDDDVEVNKSRTTRKILERKDSSANKNVSNFIQQEQELKRILKEKIKLSF